MHQEWQRPWAAASSHLRIRVQRLAGQRDRADFAGGDRRGALDADRVDLLDLGARHPERGRPVRGGLSGHLGDGRERWPRRPPLPAAAHRFALGRGAPDVAQIEFQHISSFVVTESLLDLTPYGAANSRATTCRGSGHKVATGGGVWSIPQDTGPMGNLYRTDILEQAGVTEPPATWASPPRRSGARPTRTSRTSPRTTPAS